MDHGKTDSWVDDVGGDFVLQLKSTTVCLSKGVTTCSKCDFVMKPVMLTVWEKLMGLFLVKFCLDYP